MGLIFAQDSAQDILTKLKNHRVPKKARSLGTTFLTQIETGFLPRVSVRWVSESIGFGLFAEENLPEGSYCGEYSGIVRRNDQWDKMNGTLYRYPILDDIGRNYVIDAEAGGLTRFINHSSQPNLKPHFAFVKDRYHVIFLALSSISEGTQLSFDYGSHYWLVRGAPQPL